MKKIVLLGDSIRIGYDKYVKTAFEGVADVYYPSENCRFTAYLIRHLIDWKKSMSCGDNVDLVHWNAGLWDDLIMIDGRVHTPIEVYADNVGRIFDIISVLFPRAKIVFATSTPVQEELFVGPCKRRNADTERYNAVAVRIAESKGAAINDLYGTVTGCPREYYSDLAHLYTEKGTELVTKKVISSIEEALGIQAIELDYHALFSGQKNIIGL